MSNNEDFLIQTEWAWDHVLKKGETLLVNGPHNIEQALDTTLLVSQTALALSLGRPVMLFPCHTPKKVLFINTYLDNKELFEITSTQIGGENNFSLYTENFIMVCIDADNLLSLKPKLRTMIDRVNPDIIVWDNLNSLTKHCTLSEGMSMIKELSGLRTKIISHHFNTEKESELFFNLIQQSSSAMTFEHFKNDDFYSLKLERKNGTFYSKAKVYKNEKRLSFYNINVRRFRVGDDKNYIEQDNGVMPPLPL